MRTRARACAHMHKQTHAQPTHAQIICSGALAPAGAPCVRARLGAGAGARPHARSPTPTRADCADISRLSPFATVPSQRGGRSWLAATPSWRRSAGDRRRATDGQQRFMHFPAPLGNIGLCAAVRFKPARASTGGLPPPENPRFSGGLAPPRTLPGPPCPLHAPCAVAGRARGGPGGR